MSATTIDQGLEHTCERCGRPVPKKPKGGRPFRFCPDSADEPGTSCLELDRRERDAMERAGLGALVAAWRTDSDRLLAGLLPVLGPLQQLQDRLQQIEDAAIARAEQAEQAQLRAEAAQRTAESAAREADQRTARAQQLRQEALADRDDAIENEKAAVAERLQARREAGEAISRALQSEHGRGEAQALADERGRALDAERQARTDAEEQARRLTAELQAERRENASLKQALADAGRADAELRLQHQEQLNAEQRKLWEAEAALKTAGKEIAALKTRTDVLAMGVEQEQRRTADAKQHAADLQNDLNLTRADATRTAEDLARRASDAEQRQADAERRYQELVDALAGGGFAATGGTA
ncbi:hypothetical protein [Actinoplanes sp. G11-F43]|uniref:hypothetical protein n=1 Tax=Actinoplanes sp. G11-F43 TaxID=3424130 RepID=UPI003D3581D7